ncbi:MAG TPA: BTAD domain-containing putative transcriptional regulator, partial [Burkholderiaceae bacterium]|nr:BTAD domain-containing putative transcriptional regulator [Burkholderiaceae bacterium]
MATDATSRAGIRLQLLGEPRLDLGSESFPLERKDAALLALLAIDGVTARGRAATLLWPDVDDDAARNNLRQRLHRLRKRAGRDVALTTGDTLRLADRVTHDLSQVAETLAQGVVNATGELLGSLDYADCDQLEEWLQAAREKWRSTRRNALAEIAAKLEREGQIALALQYSERLLADDPLREHAHRQLMRLHYLRGDRAAALAVFERCRDLLKRELATVPGNETAELAALIESSGALPLPAPSARPVSVLRPPRLVGRDAEWNELEMAWQQQRLALVCGEPGIGKTRLLSDFIARQDGAIVVGARPGDARVPFALLARL